MAFTKNDKSDSPMKRRGPIRRRKKVCVFCGKDNIMKGEALMKKSTIRTEFRLLSAVISMICLFSVVFGTIQPVYASTGGYPENIELVFQEKAGETIKLSNGGKSCDTEKWPEGCACALRGRVGRIRTVHCKRLSP